MQVWQFGTSDLNSNGMYWSYALVIWFVKCAYGLDSKTPFILFCWNFKFSKNLNDQMSHSIWKSFSRCAKSKHLQR
jgi:hypothetical protein